VVRDDGQSGTVVERTSTAGEGAQLVVAFADGSRFSVPEAALVARPDGTYQVGLKDGIRIAQAPAGSGASEELVVPVVAEELSVKKRQVVRGSVRVRTRVETREEVIDEPLLHGEVAVERVSVNKLFEGAAPTAREEEGVLVGTVPQPGLGRSSRLTRGGCGRRRTPAPGKKPKDAIKYSWQKVRDA
jgi:hypothetical protein